MPLPPLFRAVLRPFQAFFRMEAASGLLLFGTGVLAMLWANSRFAESYRALFHLPIGFSLGGWRTAFSFEQLVNDGLMTLFFFLVGMEIKRELVVGELASLSKAALPAIAAAGGMIVPAAFYLFFNAGGPGRTGWAIPMATDIAFAMACLALLKGRVPNALVVFLTALAIFDDLGGILVIALFYGKGLKIGWLLGAAGLTFLLWAIARLRLSIGALYACLGVLLWFALHEGGVHATIAGVVLGMSIPARARKTGREVLSALHAHTDKLLREKKDDELETVEVVAIEQELEELQSPLSRYVHLWHPSVAYGVVPLFGLANAGVSLEGVSLADLRADIPLGVAVGLVLGKPIGIFLFTFVAVRLGLARVPGGARWVQVLGVGVVGGIGFTVALFVAALAFPDARELDQAKLGIVLGSFVSAVLGFALLRLGSPDAGKLKSAVTVSR